MAVRQQGQDGGKLGGKALEVASAHGKNDRLAGIPVEGVPDSGPWCRDTVSAPT
jgi:hypothetical protein